MARYTGAVCRLCRREDMKLFLKGERCYTDKCGYERRSYPPGQHGQSRRRKRQRLRRAAAREAEGQAHLRHRGASVPRLLLQGAAYAGRHRLYADPVARAPPRQRRLPHGLRERSRRGAPARPPWPLHGQRQEGQHPELPRPSARRDPGSRGARRRSRASTRRSQRSIAAACRSGSSSTRRTSARPSCSCRPART